MKEALLFKILLDLYQNFPRLEKSRLGQKRVASIMDMQRAPIKYITWCIFHPRLQNTFFVRFI